MKPDERVHHLSRLGEHVTYGVALKEWLNDEVEKRTDLRKVESWEDALTKKGAMDFIRKLLGLLEKQEEKATKKSDYL